MRIADLPVVADLNFVKTVAHVKRWRRRNRPDKVKVKTRKVPLDPYWIGGTLYIHPALLTRLMEILRKSRADE